MIKQTTLKITKGVDKNRSLNNRQDQDQQNETKDKLQDRKHYAKDLA